MQIPRLYSQRTLFTFLLIAGLGGVYFFYFTIVVKGHQRELLKRGFRILSQIEKNVKEKQTNYQESLPSFITQYNSIHEIQKEISAVEKNESFNYNIDITKLNNYRYAKSNKYVNNITSRKDSVNFVDQLLVQLKKDLISYKSPLLEEIVVYNPLETNDTSFETNPEYIRVDHKKSLFENNAALDQSLYFVHIDRLMKSLKYDELFDDLMIKTGQGSFIYGIKKDELNTTTEVFNSKIKEHLGAFSEDVKLSETDYKMLVKPIIINDKNFYLIGLIELNKFKNIANQIDPIVLLIGLLLIFLILVFMPVIKLQVMSRLERLSGKDVFMAGFSVFIGTSIILIYMINLFSFFVLEKRHSNRELKRLNKEIIEKFDHELTLILQQIKTYPFKDFPGNGKVVNLELTKKADLIYNSFNELFTVDKDGNIDWYITTNYGSDVVKTNLKHRDYFTYARDNQNLWYFKPLQQPYYLQSIYSYTTGSNEVAISIPGSLYNVKALTTPMAALLDVIMPLGYHFTIINKHGNVLFHSARNKNLRENFLEECNLNRDLKKAINQRIDKTTLITYNNKDFHAYVAPIDGTPLFLITFHDYKMNQVKTSLILILNFIFLIFLFLFILGLCLVVLLNNRKKTLLRYNRFPFSWLLPDNNRRDSYLFLTQIIILLVTVQFLYSLFENNIVFTILQTIEVVLLISIVMFMTLKRVSPDMLFRMKGKFFIELSIILFVVVGLVLLVTVFVQGNGLGALLFISFLILVFIAFLGILKSRNFSLLSGSKEKIKDSNLSDYSIVHPAYYKFLMALILAWSAIPILIFYRISFNEINKKWMKEVHYQIIQDLEARDKLLRSEKIDSLQWVYKSNLSNSAHLRFYNTELEIDIKEKPEQNTAAVLANNTFFDEIFQPVNRVINDNLTWYDYNYDQSLTFSTGNNDSLITKFRSPDTGQINYIKSSFSNQQISSFYWIILVLVVLFTILNLLLKFVVRRITLLPAAKSHVADQESIKKEILKKDKILLVGMNHSGKDEFVDNYLNQFVESKKLEVNVILLSTQYEKILNEIRSSQHDLIILQNFEFDKTDKPLAQKKLSLLEELSNNKAKIIISSRVDNKQILYDLWSELDSLTSKERELLQRDIDRWEALLGNYYTFIYPSTTNSAEKSSPYEQFLEEELGHGKYLTDLKETIRNYFPEENDWEKRKEEMIVRIQQIAEPYYLSLWNSCSRIEKYVLHDLANDGFVNIKNRDIVDKLLELNLLKCTDRPVIFNQSFCNFLFSTVIKNEALEMERKARKEGSWNRVKLIISITLLATIVFFVISEQDLINKFTAILTATAAMIPALYSLGQSLIGSKAAK